MRTLLVLTVVSLAFLSPPARAQSDDRDFAKQVDDFFAQMKAGRIGAAVDSLYARNPMAKGKPDDMAQLRTRFGDIPSLAGAYLDNKLLTEGFIGDRYVRLEYVVYFERQPFRFWFEFYRPGEIWFVTATGGTDNVSELATEITKAKLLDAVH